MAVSKCAHGLTFHSCLYAFDFVAIYDIAWHAALVLLVIMTISVVVPSSPGYVGTFHYFSQLSLGLFGVPSEPALSYATLTHAACVLTVFVVGLVLANVEGVSLRRVQAPSGSVEPVR